MYLSPRDTFGLFNAPTVAGVNFSTGGTQLCTENPDRVILIFALAGTVQAAIAPKQIASQTDGILLGGKIDVYEVTNQQHGPLSQVAWFGFTSGVNARVIVIEVVLERYPQTRPG